jgi:hypothetical protein
MTDHFQLTAIIAAAVKDCRLEMSGGQGSAPQQDRASVEEAHCIAKAVLTAIAEAGFEISPKQATS